jgi:hypothetical protein
MQYVSEHYQQTLEVLAETLVTPQRYGALVVPELVELGVN